MPMARKARTRAGEPPAEKKPPVGPCLVGPEVGDVVALLLLEVLVRDID